MWICGAVMFNFCCAEIGDFGNPEGDWMWHEICNWWVQTSWINQLDENVIWLEITSTRGTPWRHLTPCAIWKMRSTTSVIDSRSSSSNNPDRVLSISSITYKHCFLPQHNKRRVWCEGGVNPQQLQSLLSKKIRILVVQSWMRISPRTSLLYILLHYQEGFTSYILIIDQQQERVIAQLFSIIFIQLFVILLLSLSMPGLEVQFVHQLRRKELFVGVLSITSVCAASMVRLQVPQKTLEILLILFGSCAESVVVD